MNKYGVRILWESRLSCFANEMGNLICGQRKTIYEQSVRPRSVQGPKNSVDGPQPVTDDMATLITPNDGSVPLQIDVWSDISCPWCYVAQLRLDRAIKRVEAAAGKKLVAVKWHPYIIDLSTCPVGEECLAYNKRRWGSDAWTSSLKRAGAKDGAKFKNWLWWPNSINGHRLVSYAETFGKASEAKKMLFNLTYEEGENISDIDVLCGAATMIGLPEKAREYLESDEGREQVLEQDMLAKERMRLHAVPFFIFNGKLSCSGARETDSFEAMIRKSLDSLKPVKGFKL